MGKKGNARCCLHFFPLTQFYLVLYGALRKQRSCVHMVGLRSHDFQGTYINISLGIKSILEIKEEKTTKNTE